MPIASHSRCSCFSRGDSLVSELGAGGVASRRFAPGLCLCHNSGRAWSTPNPKVKSPRLLGVARHSGATERPLVRTLQGRPWPRPVPSWSQTLLNHCRQLLLCRTQTQGYFQSVVRKLYEGSLVLLVVISHWQAVVLFPIRSRARVGEAFPLVRQWLGDSLGLLVTVTLPCGYLFQVHIEIH